MPRYPNAAPTTEGLIKRPFAALQDKIRAHSGTLHPLHIGDTYLEPLPAAQAEAQRTADHAGMHRYAPPTGVPELVAAVQKRLARDGVDRPAEAIQITAGATGGLAVLCRALLEPGDEVLMPAPFWPLMRGIIRGQGSQAVEIPFYDRLRDPGFDAEAALEAAVTAKTAAIYVNSPNNPTGAVLEGEVAAAIARVAERHDLWILCDEAYEDIWFDGERPAPLWARPDFQPRAFAAHTMSKGFGLAGARVGWIHGPTEAMAAPRGVQTYYYYGAAQPMQWAAIAALEGGAAWQAQSRRLYREAVRATADALELPAPRAGTFLFFDARPWLPEGATDALPFLGRCIDAGVLLTPGKACGDAYPTWVRLCFTCVPPADLSDALERLRGVVRSPA